MRTKGKTGKECHTSPQQDVVYSQHDDLFMATQPPYMPYITTYVHTTVKAL
jgi:hypothetical protein